MSSGASDDAMNVQSTPQGNRQDAGGARNGCQLLCPIRSAHPNLRTGTKTCDNNCKDIRRVKYCRPFSRVSNTYLTREYDRDHLKLRHRCTCPGEPTSCADPSHIGPEQLKKLCKTRRGRHETPGKQWVRIYKIIHPNQNYIPAPYVPSVSDLEAIARAPPPDFVKELAKRLQSAGDGSSGEIHLFLSKVPHFLDLVCLTGAYPDSQSVIPHSLDDTSVSAPMEEFGASEHQEAMDDRLAWDDFFIPQPDDTC
ncbi:hypothetical protein BGZ61DRAFT_538349 [Ilyonectria robusta]|uniref:uncharacterized protein n=1 Tax=Ilyonectria robusta TaxID=1079257 RepID=UPI001E8D906B|nr:uncharacterized protein BGZ61DRAFT_538349 [Ilyonectria robusta]KAH8666158.1 hypothetical protein BGZ61DRAFT_538349 [Ilyonectria robusta]